MIYACKDLEVYARQLCNIQVTNQNGQSLPIQSLEARWRSSSEYNLPHTMHQAYMWNNRASKKIGVKLPTDQNILRASGQL